MQTLGRLLTTIVRGVDDSPQGRECAVFAAWNAVSGAAVRRVSAPQRLDGRMLSICTADDTWRKQLEALAPELIFKINSVLGAPIVTRLQFRADAAAVAEYNGSVSRDVVLGDTSPYADALASDAAGIPDPELRSAFLRAASKCLARVDREERR